MESLRTYLALVDPSLLANLKGVVGQFIAIFQSENFISEEVFIARICGEKHKRQYYFDVKIRVLEALQSLLLISTVQGQNSYQKKFEQCQKKFLIAKKILDAKHPEEGIRIVKTTYKTAIEYDFTHLACELASLIHHYYVYHRPSKTKELAYADKVDLHLRDYVAEKEIRRYFFRLIRQLDSTKVSTEYIGRTLQKVQLIDGNSLKCRVYKASIAVLYFLRIQDYESLRNTCQKMIIFFQTRVGVTKGQQFTYRFYLLTVNIAERRYTEAQQVLQSASRFTAPKSFNAAFLKLYATILALHQGKYTQAYALYKQYRNTKHQHIAQQFAIIGGYFCYLYYAGHLSTGQRFRLGKYINETLLSQTDKLGSNINILIARLLVYLARDRGSFIDAVESVQSYAYRHLRGKDTQRAKRFLKILCLLPRANFNTIALERLANRHIQFLKENPVYIRENFTIEVIPFDVLLQIILKQLKQKRA